MSNKHLNYFSGNEEILSERKKLLKKPNSKIMEQLGLEDFTKQLESLNKRLKAMITGGTLTITEADELTSMVEKILKQRRDGELAKKIAQDRLSATIKNIDKRLGTRLAQEFVKRAKYFDQRTPTKVSDNASESQKEAALKENIDKLETLIEEWGKVDDIYQSWNEQYNQPNSAVDTAEREVVAELMAESHSRIEDRMYDMLEAVNNLMDNVENIQPDISSKYQKLMSEIQKVEGIAPVGKPEPKKQPDAKPAQTDKGQAYSVDEIEQRAKKLLESLNLTDKQISPYDVEGMYPFLDKTTDTEFRVTFSPYLPWSDATGFLALSLLNVAFQASFFTLLFHSHQETL